MVENKFGMFIHWGIYSLTELQEQAVVRYDMDRAEYESLKDRFNPSGDFSTPEREYSTASGTRFKRMTEACNSVDELCAEPILIEIEW